jgi:hypothetical protein
VYEEGENDMECEVKLISSLEKVFFENFTEVPEHTSGSMLSNEIYSFQLAIWGKNDILPRQACTIEIESELKPYIQLKSVEYVPSILPSIDAKSDDDYITKKPGVMFPDPLQTVKNGEVFLFTEQARSFWIVIEPQEEITGMYPIQFRVKGPEKELLAEATFNIEIIDAKLPEMSIYNTNWFHGDCIAKLHHVEIQSEEYFSIVEKYIKTYVKFGHNMILTPIFTPPLDTAVGGERPTNQLIDVTIQNGKYTFGFKNLKKWIDLCHKCGIKYFELSHLFTQWGAYHAPKIMATVDGEYKKIFGWETEALSDEYKEFLDAFMPELLRFLKKEGIFEDCIFHVSDEPRPHHEKQYRAVKEILLKYLDNKQMVDALSAYSFFEKGIVTRPVVCTCNIRTFMEHDVKDLWAYYCNSQGIKVANRFMAMPSYRNRILGQQLYKSDVEGFLHWGFNFWFTQFSTKVINPYAETSAGGAFQSGDAFVVYPLDEDGEVVCSLRLYVLNEGFQDMRALKLLESLTDRQTVLALLEEIDGYDIYPRNNQYILQLREKVNQKIKEAI